MREQKETRDKLSYMAREVLCMARDELAVCLPFFRQAAGALKFQETQDISTLGCNGQILYYRADYLLSRFASGRQNVNRSVLHMLLHFLFLHFLESKENRRLWSLACDISVEYSIDQLDMPSFDREITDSRKEMNQSLRLHGKYQNADSIYEYLLKQQYSHMELLALEQEYFVDDHKFWMEEITLEQLKEIWQKWDKIISAVGKDVKGSSHNRGSQKGQESQEMSAEWKKRHDYRRFLKRFAVLREEVVLDMDSFDYIFYHYGLQRYGNIPLIEPLEYSEMNKLEEMVIAIDTSGSCSKETVQRFMEQTYSILNEKENFFRKMNVYIIQCDCYVQDVAHITCEEDWKEYMKNLVIQGRSGTDFRPVFRYVEQLRKDKYLRNLKGLLYFTDGDGIYPQEKPEYETAFVFLEDVRLNESIPSWAVKLVVDDTVSMPQETKSKTVRKEYK